MKKQRLTASNGLGPIVCIIIDSNPGTVDKDDENANNENQIINQTGVSDDTIPAGEEQNMPDPEEYEERQDDGDMDDMPMEEPIPDIDEIEEEDNFDITTEQDEDDIIQEDEENPNDAII